MAVKRPTFSESWYRVAELKPMLRSSVQIFRQYYRGAMWYVIRDPSNNQFFRVNDAAYHFVGLLDGKRAVKEVWDICNQHLGDRAPTQNEVIQLLGQLYTSNLLWADISLDNVGLFERYRKRVNREIRGYMMNILFVRVPLFDPEWILSKWISVVGWLFGPIGFIFWAILIGFGLTAVLSNYTEFTQGFKQENFLQTENLMMLYLVFGIIKICHEFGHGFACKRYGVLNGSGGEVHTLGIMLLVLAPVPYVDASSSWAFRSKWQRFFVGAGGMYVELAIASVAALYWAGTTGNSVYRDIAYNVIFVSSVSTILFNANPLLRYDGYYMLSDVLEIPNLSQRGKQYLHYLVKRYIFGADQLTCPAHSAGEKFWLFIYTIASMIYRVFVCFFILLFITQQLFFIGFILAGAAAVTWVVVPIGKFIQYLATNGELSRCRNRAVISTILVLGLFFGITGLWRLPENHRAEGIVEPTRYADIFMASDGYISNDILESGSYVEPDNGYLLTATNPELEALLRKRYSDLKVSQFRYQRSEVEDPSLAPLLFKEISDKKRLIADAQDRLEKLKIKAPFKGQWVSADVERSKGAFFQKGQRLGLVASTDDLFIKIVTSQELGPRIIQELAVGDKLELRARNNPAIHYQGEIIKIVEIGKTELPDPSLSTLAGGTMDVDPKEKSGTTSTSPFFEIHVKIGDYLGSDKTAMKLMPRQRVIARLPLNDKPLLHQWGIALRQLVQGNFGI